MIAEQHKEINELTGGFDFWKRLVGPGDLVLALQPRERIEAKIRRILEEKK